MSLGLQSPFLGTPLLHGWSLNRRDNIINVTRRAFRSKRICSEKEQNDSYLWCLFIGLVWTEQSESIQREVDFGKVRRVSPLCITLEACSGGEEFSCGEVPTMKLCVRPFASLRRGKIVVDAILSNPTVLVAQKKDFTWLGIPLSEPTLPSHPSSEEGIDFRTKTRRLAREEAGIRWDSERDNDARKAAEMGYIVPCKSSSQAKDDVVKHDRHFTEIANPNPFICMDEKMHSADQHCMDPGVDYDVKHAELDKSFGIKLKEVVFNRITGSSKKLTGGANPNAADSVPHLRSCLLHVYPEKTLPVMLDSISLYGDTEPREMRNIHGHVKFENHYGRATCLKL